VGENTLALQCAIVIDASPSQREPVGGAEVDSLRKVVSLIKAGMVGAGKCNDVFTSILFVKI